LIQARFQYACKRIDLNAFMANDEDLEVRRAFIHELRDKSSLLECGVEIGLFSGPSTQGHWLIAQRFNHLLRVQAGQGV
jgi:hypothetical protein